MAHARTKAGALTLAAALTAAAVAAADTADAAVGTDTKALRNAVTLEGVRGHQAALQAIANANAGTREASSPGFQASVDYVADKLDDAGYEVELQEFDYVYFADLSAPTLTIGATSYDDQIATMTYSNSGNVTGTLVPVDLALDDPPSSTSGCEPADFADYPDPSTTTIAVIQRGACNFSVKAANAEAAGADAVIIFNQGDDPDDPERTDLFFGTLGEPFITVPVVSAPFSLGAVLEAAAGQPATVTADVLNDPRTSTNVIADTTTGRTDRVVVVGAHLDSVAEGPGINDNGSGSAAILEIALQMAALGIQPRNQVRFAFWGAEEAGLIGSEHYVGQLTARERKSIALNLNFDMLGSPNFVRFVYDGDGSDGAAGPNGSGVIEKVFLDYFAAAGLPTEPTAFDGRSDYGPFIEVGIPAGGLFSGAEETKSAEQAAIYGGTAGVAFDPCYHQACDTFANNNDVSLDQLSDAAAHAVLTFAMTTSAVNGTSKASSKPAEPTYDGSAALR